MRLKCLLIVLLSSLSIVPAMAEQLMNLVTVQDGLDTKEPTNIADDYVRLQLINPSYSTMNTITVTVNDWLGPNMAKAQSSKHLLIQAPRDPSQRVSFLSALMQMDITLQP